MSATNDISLVIESLSHAPNGLDRPLESAAILAAGAIATYACRRIHNKAEESYSADLPDPDQALMSIKQVMGRDARVDERGNRKARMNPVYVSIGGLAMVGASFFGHPTYEQPHATMTPNVAVVTDVTLSMWNTKDIGTLPHDRSLVSRDQAANAGLSTSHYKGNLAVVQTADTATPVIPLQSAWRQELPKLLSSHVGQHGELQDIVPAIQLAASLLPTTSNTKAHESKGTLVIVSDGTVDDTSAAMSTEAAALRKDGVQVDVIVAGTMNGTYQEFSNGPHYQSGVEPSTFAAFGQSSIQEPTTAIAVESDVAHDLHAASTESKRQSWLPPYVVGAGLLLVGMGKLIKRSVTAVV